MIPLVAGDRVRMSEALKRQLQRECFEQGCKLDKEGECERLCSSEHVREFGDCVGVVEGLTNYNNRGEPEDPNKIGPEVDVRWEPSRLRYAYAPELLELVR